MAYIEEVTARTNHQMSTYAWSTCRCCQRVVLREAEAIGGGAHARKRRVAGHVRALLSRADATTQVGSESAVTMQFLVLDNVILRGPAAGGLCIIHNASSRVHINDCVPRCSVTLPHSCFHLMSCCVLAFSALCACAPEVCCCLTSVSCRLHVRFQAK